MKRILNILMSFVIISSIGGSMLVVSAPQMANAALRDNCNQGFLGFPSWYRGLTKAPPGCDIKDPNTLNTAGAGEPNNGLSNFIWRIVLNVAEMAIVAAAYLSGFMFLYGGWLFIISQGKPEGAAKARSVMMMAAIGLVLTISAVTLINFIYDKVINIVP